MEHTTPEAETSQRAEAEDVAELESPEAGATRGATLPPDAGAPIGPTPPPSGSSRLFSPPPRPEPAVRPLPPPRGDSAAVRPADRIPSGSPSAPGRAPSHGTTILVALLAGIVGAALTIGALGVAGVFDRPETLVEQVVAPTAPPAQIVVDGNTSSTAAAVAQKVVPSIVSVEVAAENGDEFDAFGSGSGVILSSDGLIVTNHHVIADADLAQVILQNGFIYEATIVGTDPVTDLAVLRINLSGLTPIEFGSTEGLAIGDQAVAVGNPLGLPGGASVTVGVVSAFDREVTVGAGPNDRLFGMLQTDAPITRGSSGGALVDAAGRLIGITTAIGVTDAGAEGVGFAIPVELMTRITDEIIEKGFVQHTFLGVLLQDNFEERDGAQIPEGATIIDFVDPSGARDAGLEVGDRLTSINGLMVRTKEDIINELRKFRVGDVVAFEVDRDGELFSTDVVLGERPASP